MKMSNKSGATLAAAAAALMLSGAVVTTANAGVKGEIHCQGVNACKGKTGCATASNKCKGLNACKGKGWVSMRAESCTNIGGKLPAAKADAKK